METTNPTQQPTTQVDQEQSNTTINVITILLLVFFYPVGVIVMWFATKWSKGVKIAVTALMIVPIILGILATVVLVALNPAEQLSKARDNERNVNQQLISSSLEMYYVQNNSYPNSLNDLVVSDYLAETPIDPTTQQPYSYKVLENGQDYVLCVIYETDIINPQGEYCINSRLNIPE